MKLNLEGLKFDEGSLQKGKVKWQSPSNIALVKYWGKHGEQLPNNPSISFTLDHAHTNTEIQFTPKTNNDSIELDFFFEGKSNELFGAKIQKFLQKHVDVFP